MNVPHFPGTAGHAAVAEAAELLLRVNEQTGTIRPGVTVEYLFLAVARIWQLDLREDWEPRLAWLLDLVMDGLRAGAPER
ncbi:hypothetical protein GCM10017557_80040 [Streptomyces aurantiacus]|uniref:Transcriptional regulator SbtR-like C-terminal domain-containing protein n=1 Tax=Streptomyces aurantiacus TaxID=47760 RepID=A0A7G1PHM3_9ACTN|nr:hypothetical protein GCM10017557_80040 [Streptomyces aurantiacus]